MDNVIASAATVIWLITAGSFWVLFSVVIGIWSRRKGGSFIAGLLFSMLLSPLIAALILAVRKPDKEAIERRELARGRAKKCPHCAELIRVDAKVCRFCGKEVA